MAKEEEKMITWFREKNYRTNLPSQYISRRCYADFDNNVIINNPYIKSKIMNTHENYSFKSNLIDGKKSSVENLGILTSQLSSLLKFSGKENISKKKIVKKEKSYQNKTFQMSSQSTLSSNSDFIF